MTVASTAHSPKTTRHFITDISTLAQRIRFAVLLVLTVVAIALAVSYLTNALTWRNHPFLGVMVAHTMNVSGGQSVTADKWAGHSAGIETGDRILSINGENVIPGTGTDYLTVLDDLETSAERDENGDIIATIDFERVVTDENTLNSTICGVPNSAGVSQCNVTYSLTTLPDRDFWAFFIVPFLSGVFVLSIATGLIYFKPIEPVSFAITVTCILLAISMLGIFDVGSTHQFIPLWIFSGALLASMFLTVAILFPIPIRTLFREPRLRFIPAILGIALGAYDITLFNAETTTNFNVSIRIITLLILISIATLAGALFFYHRVRAVNAIAHDQSNTVLIGISLAMLPGAVWIVAQGITALGTIIPGFDPDLAFPFSIETTMPFLLTIAISMGYAVLQYRQFDTDQIISQGLTYIILALALVTGYYLLVLGLTALVSENTRADDPLIIAFVIFLISALFIPVRTRIQSRIDEIYYKKRRNYQNKLEAFGQHLAGMETTAEIVDEFRTALDETIQPSNIFVFMHDIQSDSYVPYGETDTDIIFSDDSGIVELLREDEQVFCLEPGVPWPRPIRSERARINILRSVVIASIGMSDGIPIGFITLGYPKRGSDMYTFEEVRFINNLVGQVGVAIERSQVISSYEQQVNQLNVLSKISQAVNFTIEPDDLLELIVTQTERIIEAPYFYIVLFDSGAEQVYFAFFLEDDDRDENKEGIRWMTGNDLYSEVIATSRPIKVVDYGREISRKNYKYSLESRDTKAWMGVPLIAGTGTLGVMAVGDSRENRTFSDAQLQVFNDIGTLAAASLYQARLFTEANARARQLGVLNDISRQLVESEENVEQLLDLITNEAVNILEAQAGSLLLITEDNTGDLEFKSVASGNDDLIGTRLKAGYGIVGEVAESGIPIISNDTSKDERFDGDLDEGFHTKSILAVPLTAKSGVIGVLEVINKQDGSLFNEDDQELLTTFAGQAAIALENARLFQETDQALQLRVQELEDLQRFSEELSRTLNLTEVTAITVKGAMARTSASAGLIALVNDDENQIQIASAYGYMEETFPEGVFNGEPWDIDKGIIKRVLRTRQPDLAPDVAIDPDYFDGLPGALSQITIPMMSGDRISAILVLETNKEPRFTLLDQVAVMRIAEQASIAIANAQLYEQITTANETKSEFVGFAAHELKTPLTSVKGYAATLTSSMVDQIDGDQIKQFANIIQNNASRMQSIIDDLQVIAQIDANKFPIKPEPAYLDKIVQDTLIPFQKQLEEKEQTIVNNVGENLPLIMADNNKLVQVLTNFISNAYKYSPPGATITIEAKVHPRYINSRNQNMGSVMEISISDTGIGMTEDDLSALFKEDYFRSSNTEARKQKGTGLGMIITKRIIEGHNGEVWDDSEIEKGTTFAFVIPLAPRDPMQTQTMQTTETEPASD